MTMQLSTQMSNQCQNVLDSAGTLRQLLALITEGNTCAFERLYRLVAPVLAGYARRCTDSAGNAEEILQESLLAIWRTAHRYNPALAAPMTWLRNIVRNQAVDLHRRQMAQLPCSTGEWEPCLHASAAPDPCASLESAQANAALSSWLQGLGTGPRRAIELTWLAELSHQEAATVMDRPLGTVKTMVRRGLGQLRERAVASGAWA